MYYLDFKPMNEQDMIDYLGELKDLEEKIPVMIDNEYKKCESPAECIYRNTFYKMEQDGSKRYKHRSGDPVYRIFMAVYKDLKRQSRIVDQEIQRIRSWEDKLKYVEYCLLELSHEQREIITDLYVRNENIKAYAVKNCISDATARRLRKEAMDILLNKYNSYFSAKGKADL